MKDLTAILKGTNLWTLKQKIKDCTTSKRSTIQLLQRVDIYRFTDEEQEQLKHFKGKETQAFINSHGRLLRSTGEMKSHSFVRQFLQLLEVSTAHLYGAASDVVSILDVGNAPRNVSPTIGVNAEFYWATEAPSATSTYGTQIGTGVTAPATTDYKLQTPIAHGVGAGNLQYGSCSVGGAALAGANMDMSIIRTFTNGSGNPITAREIGLYISNVDTVPTQRYFCVAHDAVNQAIANGETAVVAYTLRTTV